MDSGESSISASSSERPGRDDSPIASLQIDKNEVPRDSSPIKIAIKAGEDVCTDAAPPAAEQTEGKDSSIDEDGFDDGEPQKIKMLQSTGPGLKN